MVSAVSVFVHFLYILPSLWAFEQKVSQLGCFSGIRTGLLYEATGRGDTPDLNSCLAICIRRNFTFAGSSKTRCNCGNYLGESSRVPVRDCLEDCTRIDCTGRIRFLVFILQRDLVEIEHGAVSKSSRGVSDGQWEMIGVGTVVLVFLLSLLIHCVRVSRRRSRLTRLYISSLERGERGGTRPPGWLRVSNMLCAEFFFCCCPGGEEGEEDGEVNLDYEELLHDLDLRHNPQRRKSFTTRIRDYIRHCEKERNMERFEIERMLRTLSKEDNLSNRRSSLRNLARKLGIGESRNTESRHASGSRGQVKLTRSSLPTLHRKSRAPSSLENTFHKQNSRSSMYNNNNLPRRSNTSPLRRALISHSNMAPVTFDGAEEVGSESQFSQSTRASSLRLLPVSREHLRSGTSRHSRHKRSDHSESAHRAYRKRSRYADSDSDSDISER